MRSLLIVGARGWGREVYYYISKTKEVQKGDLVVKGFLDSKTDAFAGLRGDFPPIICSPEEYIVEPNDVFFIAMGDPHWRKHYAELIEKKGGSFYTYVSPEACVFDNAIAERNIITANEGCYRKRLWDLAKCCLFRRRGRGGRVFTNESKVNDNTS